MSSDYGFGELENKLISLFRSGRPDFDVAEELLRQGVNINAFGKKNNNNVLSAILCGYWQSESGDTISEQCDNCDEDCCDNCEYNRNVNPNLGESMCAVIRFFLSHGFDVSEYGGCFCAQCLWALNFSTFDRYMVEAVKLLFDAGAKNRTVSANSSVTPWSIVDVKRSYIGACEHDYAAANIYETVFQLYKAVEDGRPYSGIDTYEIAVGKNITKVLAERNTDAPAFFSIGQAGFTSDNCFNTNLYFVYDGGVLIITPYADFWTDTALPAAAFEDVSAHFRGILGSAIQRFIFDYKSVQRGAVCYDQPITLIEMNSGHKVKFSVNIGEVKKENRSAYFEIIW